MKKGYGCRSGDDESAAQFHRAAAWSPMRQPGVGGDFQSIHHDGRPIKIVSIVDEHTRECLGGGSTSITGEHLIDELDRLAAGRGIYPRAR